MDQLLKQRLVSTLDECATHVRRMDYAHGKLRAFMPVTAETVHTLDDVQVEALDQYIYRFTKLQDAMGGRLFNQSLQLLAEDVQQLAFIDKLNRLEKLGALRSAIEWLDLRGLRNSLAHEYADNANELADGINTVFDKHSDIQQVLAQFKAYINRYLEQ